MNQNTFKEEAVIRPRRNKTGSRDRGYLPGDLEIHHAPVAERSAGYARVKRVADVTAAAVMFLLSLPVMFFACVLVRLTSSGPAIYVQTRLGRNGKPFSILKIRTMVDNCESLTGPRWSLPGDPRITPVGRVLRATHVDELPQFWNVLRGDMSLIGPRPERPEIISRLLRDVPDYTDRLKVRPGITGLAQVQLPPDSDLFTVADKLVLDRAYISQLSAKLDFIILMCTAIRMLGVAPTRVRFLLRSAIPSDFKPGKRSERNSANQAA
jgi:lipopolysaccharide/colanic/teichoic acid biosynthesis glycosyltransferase